MKIMMKSRVGIIDGDGKNLIGKAVFTFRYATIVKIAFLPTKGSCSLTLNHLFYPALFYVTPVTKISLIDMFVY
jgi:hypothetical protein